MSKKREKSSGFTLVELIVTMVLCAMVILTLSVHLIANTRFHRVVRERVAALREARIAMDHMIRVLRFADISTVAIDANRISATIQGTHPREHLSFITQDTHVEYDYAAGDRTITYTQDANAPEVIARDITAFNAAWNIPYLTIQLTAERYHRPVNLETDIRCLGDLVLEEELWPG